MATRERNAAVAAYYDCCECCPDDQEAEAAGVTAASAGAHHLRVLQATVDSNLEYDFEDDTDYDEYDY